MVGSILRIVDVINWAAIKNNVVTILLATNQFADIVVYLDCFVQSRAFLAKANVIALFMQRSKRFFFANVVIMRLDLVVYECAFS